MFELNIDTWAVIANVLVLVIISTIYHSEFGFGTLWVRLTKVKKKDINPTPFHLLQETVIALAEVITMAALVSWIGLVTQSEGALLGLIVGIGLATTQHLRTGLWEHQPKELIWINSSYTILAFVITGAIQAEWAPIAGDLPVILQ